MVLWPNYIVLGTVSDTKNTFVHRYPGASLHTSGRPCHKRDGPARCKSNTLLCTINALLFYFNAYLIAIELNLNELNIESNALNFKRYTLPVPHLKVTNIKSNVLKVNQVHSQLVRPKTSRVAICVVNQSEARAWVYWDSLIVTLSSIG